MASASFMVSPSGFGPRFDGTQVCGGCPQIGTRYFENFGFGVGVAQVQLPGVRNPGPAPHPVQSQTQILRIQFLKYQSVSIDSHSLQSAIPVLSPPIHGPQPPSLSAIKEPGSQLTGSQKLSSEKGCALVEGGRRGMAGFWILALSAQDGVKRGTEFWEGRETWGKSGRAQHEVLHWVH